MGLVGWGEQGDRRGAAGQRGDSVGRGRAGAGARGSCWLGQEEWQRLGVHGVRNEEGG